MVRLGLVDMVRLDGGYGEILSLRRSARGASPALHLAIQRFIRWDACGIAHGSTHSVERSAPCTVVDSQPRAQTFPTACRATIMNHVSVIVFHTFGKLASRTQLLQTDAANATPTEKEVETFVPLYSGA